MRYKLITIIILALFPLIVSAQSISDVNVKRERTFTGSGLFGFMNGGAEQYLEYGVQSLVTRDLVYKGEEFTVDIYEMPSAADAFGIYSLHVFKCLKADSLRCFDCLSTYQLQMAAGNKYVSVVFQSGTKAAKNAVYELIRLYINVNNEEVLTVPAELNIELPYSGNLKYLRGKLSVSSASALLSTIVEDIPFLGIWFVTDKATKVNSALIQLVNNSDLDIIKERVGETDVIKAGEDYIYIKCKKAEVKKQDFDSFGF